LVSRIQRAVPTSQKVTGLPSISSFNAATGTVCGFFKRLQQEVHDLKSSAGIIGYRGSAWTSLESSKGEAEKSFTEEVSAALPPRSVLKVLAASKVRELMGDGACYPWFAKPHETLEKQRNYYSRQQSVRHSWADWGPCPRSRLARLQQAASGSFEVVY
jgi:hypothetical protein